MRRFPYLLVALFSTAALLAGCNLPFLVQDVPNAQTAAALTVQAQLSPIAALSATPTLTPVPFPTLPPASTLPPANTLPPAATATSNCDSASFVTDVTIPDNTQVDPGESFTKTWRIKNVGTCSWTSSYAVVFVSDNSMSGPSVQALTGNVNPGQTVDLSVDLTAPAADGNYTGNWGLRNGSGVIFGHFWVKVAVNNGPFAVIHVTYDLTTFDDGGYTGCPKVTAHIQTNDSGDVQYHWTWSDGGVTPNESVHFNAAGTKDVSTTWKLGSGAPPGTYWIGMYIDSPNHQDFGHKVINKCTTP